MQIDPAKAGSDEQLLEMLIDAHIPLPEVAAINHITLEELADWALRKRDKLSALKELADLRAKLVAAEAQTAAIKTLVYIAESHADDERNQLLGRDLKSVNTRARQREVATKACTQLLRLNKSNAGCHQAPAESGCHQSTAESGCHQSTAAGGRTDALPPDFHWSTHFNSPLALATRSGTPHSTPPGPDAWMPPPPSAPALVPLVQPHNCP